MKYLTTKLLNILIFNDRIPLDTESIAFYRYGIEITISSILNIVLVLIIGFIINCVEKSIVFLFLFIVIRSVSGGYHASSYFKCNLLMCSSFLGIVIASKILNNLTSWIWILPVSIAMLITVGILSPIPNINKPIKQDRKTKYKLFSFLICLGFLSLSYLYTVQTVL